ncbi:MAG: hypothetical protein GY827_09520 [Cytophagales bacterium]|nr:hypothetical protein [Cytophagales bacterium]
MSFLKKIFGPSQKEVWMEVAKSVGGDFVEGSGLADPHTIIVKHHNWEIVVDHYAERDHEYIRVRIPVVNTSNILLMIYEESFLSSIGKVLGAQDILIGNKQFDDKFMIKGNNTELITQLFSNEYLRESIVSTEKFSLVIGDEKKRKGMEKSFPVGVSEIRFEESITTLKDPIKLKSLIELSYLLLDTLVEIEAISSKDAGISLKE